MVETKRCGDCKTRKPITAFHRRGPKRRGQPYCKQCYVERGREARKDPAYRARQSVNSSLCKLGISREDYEAAEARQEGRCAICDRTPERRLHIDHDHDTGELRGLLCHHCNTALGNFRDDPELLQRAIEYLGR